jgi:hypothetical protein
MIANEKISENSGSESESAGPKSQSKDLYAEIYRYPIRKQTINHPPRNEKKWNFVVTQEMEDMKRQRAEDKGETHYLEYCKKHAAIHLEWYHDIANVR